MKTCKNACGFTGEEDGFSRSRGKPTNECKKCKQRRTAAWARKPENAIHELERKRNKNREDRESVLNHYGRKCACCGESKEFFLVIDHINEDGHIQRREALKKCNSMYRWIVKSGFPNGLQTMCHNCNHAKFVYGSCPCQTNTTPTRVYVYGSRASFIRPRLIE